MDVVCKGSSVKGGPGVKRETITNKDLECYHQKRLGDELEPVWNYIYSLNSSALTSKDFAIPKGVALLQGYSQHLNSNILTCSKFYFPLNKHNYWDRECCVGCSCANALGIICY